MNAEREVFPRGGDASSPVFSGPVWLAQLLDPAKVAATDTMIYNVTFAAGCRNNWRRHSGGQILLATRGVGYHQIRGQAIGSSPPPGEPVRRWRLPRSIAAGQ